ncbi:MAG TPA: hypothetical protein PLM22_03105 [Candidatus Sabulitectum sp.]|nr:hypothetical protein [Candidatus Sabulitectum sp.]HPF32842.1 hypothetical protein [Candidatus Sabulitectum sp.]HPJ27894.1 hypothetical protein [Candidatus Sabulitectum sp.]HPR21877.1 hypothetical protein [Candidatus Sabulitectum sp.]
MDITEGKADMDSSGERDTLHLLSIFHFVLAGFIALMACLPLFHLAGGLFMVFGGVAENEPGLSVAGGFFSLFAGGIILVGWGIAYLVFRAGRGLNVQKDYQLCLIAAAVLCMIMPFGTILGVFTLVKLNEQKVKDLFQENAPEVVKEPEA